MNSLEDRAGLMMEAYLDEGNTLIKPLLERKLDLISQLDRKICAAEVQLDERRKRVIANKKRGSPDIDIRGVESLEREIEEMYNEKVATANQLLDLARRPHETIFEVAALLKNCSPSGETSGPVVAKPPKAVPPPSQSQAVYASSHMPSSVSLARPPVQTQSSLPIAPKPFAMPTELWCYCRKPDDGRTMVACDNQRCGYQWWHIDCIQQFVLQFNVGVMPVGENAAWFCPVCLRANRDSANSYSSQRVSEDSNVRRRAR